MVNQESLLDEDANFLSGTQMHVGDMTTKYGVWSMSFQKAIERQFVH